MLYATSLWKQSHTWWLQQTFQYGWIRGSGTLSNLCDVCKA